VALIKTVNILDKFARAASLLKRMAACLASLDNIKNRYLPQWYCRIHRIREEITLHSAVYQSGCYQVVTHMMGLKKSHESI